jgi:hypothetical protein
MHRRRRGMPAAAAVSTAQQPLLHLCERPVERKGVGRQASGGADGGVSWLIGVRRRWLFQEAAAQICAAQAEALRTRMKLKGAGLRGGAEAGESGDAIVNFQERRGAVEDRLQVRGVSTLWQQPPRVWADRSARAARARACVCRRQCGSRTPTCAPRRRCRRSSLTDLPLPARLRRHTGSARPPARQLALSLSDSLSVCLSLSLSLSLASLSLCLSVPPPPLSLSHLRAS